MEWYVLKIICISYTVLSSTLLQDHTHQKLSSHQTWFQMHLNSEILLNCPAQERVYIYSPSVARGLRYFSKWRNIVTHMGRVEKYCNPHGQLKENLFLPLFNTNFISKSFKITDLTTSSRGLQIFPPLVQWG